MASDDIVIRLREQSDDDSSPETLCQYAADEIELLRSQVPRWISAEERLPADGVWVLYQDGYVTSPYPGGTPQAIHIGIVLNGEWCDQSYRLLGGRQNPVCWMPLPEMHKEKNISENLSNAVEDFFEALDGVIDARRDLREAEGCYQVEQIREKNLGRAYADFADAFRSLLERTK